MTRKEKQKQHLKYFAEKHMGKPYLFGAKHYVAPKRFDCSSFVQYLYQRIGMDLPRTALQQAHLGQKINPQKGDLQIGDLIFIKGSEGHYNREFPAGIGHVFLYLEEGQVISARWRRNKNGSEGGQVAKEPLSAVLKRPDLIVIKRII